MKTLIVSIATATGSTVELHHGKERDTVELDAVSAEGKTAKGMQGRARIIMHRLELHQLYKACETAWADMDDPRDLTDTTNSDKSNPADRVSPNPESVAG